MSYYYPYLVLAVMFLCAVGFALGPLIIAWFVAPKKPSKIKNAIYECGLESKGDAWVQFKVQYYIYALMFVIFDIEVLFILPWAVAYGTLGWAAFGVMILFLVILAEGLVYAWKKGVLRWN